MGVDYKYVVRFLLLTTYLLIFDVQYLISSLSNLLVSHLIKFLKFENSHQILCQEGKHLVFSCLNPYCESQLMFLTINATNKLFEIYGGRILLPTDCIS